MTVATMRALFKRDANGSMRTWHVERDCPNARYRVLHGIVGGATVETGWVQVQGNTLRSPAEQCAAEVEALYKHRLKTDYFETQSEAMAGPRHLEPMLAKGFDAAGKRLSLMGQRDPSTGKAAWLCQPKLDGIRALAKADGLYSRSGEKFLTTGMVEEALAPLFRADPDLVLDGELYNHAYHDRFNELSGLVRKGMNAKSPPTADELAIVHSMLQYHVYDVPSHPGGQAERILHLLGLDLDTPLVHPVETVEVLNEHSDRTDLALYERFLSEGYEGAMYRLASAPYQYGRRPWDLLKRKEFITREFPIKRVEEGEGDWKGKVKRIVYDWDDGREFASGLRMSMADAEAWWNRLDGDGADGCPAFATVRFMPPPAGAVPRVAVAIDFHGPNGRRD